MDFNNTANAFEAKSDIALRKAAFLFRSMSSPWIVKMGIFFTHWALRFHLPIKGLIKRTIYDQFCGGETLQEAESTAHHLNQYHVSVIMDYGVEGKSNEEEFEKTTEKFLQTISFAKGKSYIPFISLKVTAFARFGLLEKIERGEELTSAEKQEFQRVADRVKRICSQAVACDKMILIDAEETWIQKPVDDLANSMMQAYNGSKAYIFNTFQLYCHDRLRYLKESHQMAIKNNFILGAKLVRGAYMEKERERALQMNYPSPIQPDKSATDRDYNLAVLYCLDHRTQIDLFIGTHNDASCMLAVNEMLKRQIPASDPKVYFSQLHGMSDHISFNLAKEGFNVAKYLPYGPVQDVIPYLMRRAQENTSVAGQTGRELSLIEQELIRRKSK